MIWSLVLLVCDPTMCSAMSGPITVTEEDCHASLQENVEFIGQQYPFASVVSYRCIAWGSAA